MLFIFFGFSLLHHILLLPVSVPFMWRWRQAFSRSTEFVWLVVFPIVVMCFAVLAGLLCKWEVCEGVCVCVAFFGGGVWCVVCECKHCIIHMDIVRVMMCLLGVIVIMCVLSHVYTHTHTHTHTHANTHSSICDFSLSCDISDYIFEFLTILVAVGGFSIVTTITQALKYTFKVVLKIHVHVRSLYPYMYTCTCIYITVCAVKDLCIYIVCTLSITVIVIYFCHQSWTFCTVHLVSLFSALSTFLPFRIPSKCLRQWSSCSLHSCACSTRHLGFSL